MKINITEKILLKIGNIADAHKFEIYVVGGYVRDYFLEKERNDFDITVVGDSLAFTILVAKEFNSTPVIYERFRTGMVPIGKHKVEFVGTRKEEYSEQSRKPLVVEGTLFDDLKRRDFKVNSMAASLNKVNFGILIDEFDGLNDLNNKILQTPLDPIVTYSDDPLRMMRAARFASQLQFRIEETSFEAIIKMSNRIKIISQERISDEFFKILSSPKPSIGLYILFNTGLLQHIFPEVYNLSGVDIVSKGDKNFAHKDVFKHTLKVLDNISLMTENVWLRFAALTHDIAKPKTKKYIEGIGWTFYAHEEIGSKWMPKIFNRMKLPLSNLEYVQKLIRLHQRPMTLVEDGVTDSAIRRLAVQAGDALEDLFTLCRADITTKNPNLSSQYLLNYDLVTQKIIEVQDRDKLREFQSPVKGEEIMKLCNINPSKLVGFLKFNIEEAILEGVIPNEYNLALEYFLKNKDIWLTEFDDSKYRSGHR